MPTVTITGHGACEAADSQRLVLALEACGVDIGHRCGGKARCTTCRVRFHDGEPNAMTEAEHAKLSERDLLGEVRLACQILTDGPMAVEVLMHTSEMGWDDPGPTPTPEIEPDPVWRD